MEWNTHSSRFYAGAYVSGKTHSFSTLSWCYSDRQTHTHTHTYAVSLSPASTLSWSTARRDESQHALAPPVQGADDEALLAAATVMTKQVVEASGRSRARERGERFHAVEMEHWGGCACVGACGGGGGGWGSGGKGNKGERGQEGGCKYQPKLYQTKPHSVPAVVVEGWFGCGCGVGMVLPRTWHASYPNRQGSPDTRLSVGFPHGLTSSPNCRGSSAGKKEDTEGGDMGGWVQAWGQPDGGGLQQRFVFSAGTGIGNPVR